MERDTNAAPARPVRLTGRDLEVLAFAAEHRLVLAEHIAALLHVSVDAARRRLGGLTRSEFLTASRPYERAPRCYRIARPGLAAIDSDLQPSRRLDLRAYDHEVGAAWLWLAARAGRFGPVRQVIGERRLRSADARQAEHGSPYGVRLGGVGPGGRERLHYPDLLLVGAEGRRIAIELELSSKGRVRRERIVAGYGADTRTDVVLYLVRDRRIGRSIRDSARRLGLEPLVHVQRVALRRTSARDAPARALERPHTRPLRAVERAP